MSGVFTPPVGPPVTNRVLKAPKILRKEAKNSIFQDTLEFNSRRDRKKTENVESKKINSSFLSGPVTKRGGGKGHGH